MLTKSPAERAANSISMACKSNRLDWAPISQQEKDTLKGKMEGREAIAKEVRKLAKEDCEFRVVQLSRGLMEETKRKRRRLFSDSKRFVRSNSLPLFLNIRFSFLI